MKIIFLDIDGVLNRGSTVEKIPSWVIILIMIIGVSCVWVPHAYHYFVWPSADGEIVGNDTTMSYQSASSAGESGNVAEIAYEIPGDEEMHIAYQPTIIFPAREGKHVTVHYNQKNHDEIVSTMLIKFMVPVTALMLLFFVNDIKNRMKNQ